MEVSVDFVEITNKAKKIIRSPKAFFKSSKKEKGIKESFVYFFVISLVGSLLSFLGSLIFGTEFESTLVESILFFSTSFVIGLGFVFVVAAAVHAAVRIFKGKSSYKKTYQAYAYSSTPGQLFGWVPYLSIVALLYGLYVFVIGVEEFHKLSKLKAIVAIVVSLALFFIFAFGWIAIGLGV